MRLPKKNSNKSNNRKNNIMNQLTYSVTRVGEFEEDILNTTKLNAKNIRVEVNDGTYTSVVHHSWANLPYVISFGSNLQVDVSAGQVEELITALQEKVIEVAAELVKGDND